MDETLREAAKQVRNFAFTSLRAVGGFTSIAASAWRRRRLLILCYHGVALQDEHEWDGRVFVTPAFLRRRVEILRGRGYWGLAFAGAGRKVRFGTPSLPSVR